MGFIRNANPAFRSILPKKARIHATIRARNKQNRIPINDTKKKKHTIMEDKKLDKNSIIGFILIFGILVWIMYQNQPTEAQLKADKAKKELQLAAEKAKETPKPATTAVFTAASATAEIAKLNATLGSFANSGILSTDKNEFVTLENELLLIKVATKGGAITEVTLKKHEKFRKNSKQLVQLISNNNADFGLEFQTKTNQIINTRDLRFTPIETKVSNN